MEQQVKHQQFILMKNFELTKIVMEMTKGTGIKVIAGAGSNDTETALKNRNLWNRMASTKCAFGPQSSPTPSKPAPDAFYRTSGAKNFMFPNSNTENGFDSEVNRIAHNTICRGGMQASHILVPAEKRA